MIDQYTGLLVQAAQYNAKSQRVELKSIWDDENLWTSSSTTATTDQTATYYRAVPWLYRAVEMRANDVADMPFNIYRGDEVVETSENWENKLGVMPDPYRLLWLVEAALCFGPAYVWRERNRVKTTALRYVAASTITPELDAVLGLTGFVRRVGTMRKDVAPEDMIYFWKPDPHIELGPPAHTPVGAALAAAGVLYNADQFAAAFFSRGAIKATLLTVDGNPSPEAKNDLKRWWQRAVTGINNSFATNVISASVKPVVVGDGLDSLQDATLTATKREDISTALGIPQTLLFSTGAGGLGGGGVVRQDDLHYYTKTIMPECHFIQGVLNEQFFRPMGLRFEFKPETLDVFQADEHERAGSFRAYVDAGLPIELVGEMLGLDLPDGWTWEKIAADKEAKREAMAEQMAGKPASDDEDEDDDGPTLPPPPMATTSAPKAMLDDLRAWRRKSQKRGKLADFESDAIPADTMKAIHEAGDWLAALDAAIDGKPTVKAQVDLRGKMWEDVQRLYEQRITVRQFVSSAKDTVEEECEQAWNDGMVKNGLDPEKDAKPEHALALLAIIAALAIHLRKLGKDVEQARRDEKDIETLRSRVDLWANRYPDVVNQAMIATKPDGRFEWVFGNTEKHCSTCAALAGHVATGKEWQDSGYKPQGTMLECGGWNCDCSLIPTDARSMGVPSA